MHKKYIVSYIIIYPQRDTKINLLCSLPWESWRQVPDKELEKLSSENRKTDLDPYLPNFLFMPQAEDQNILWLTASHPTVKPIMHTKLPISSVGSHSTKLKDSQGSPDTCEKPLSWKIKTKRNKQKIELRVNARSKGEKAHTQKSLSNCRAGEDSWASLQLQGDQANQSWRKSTLNIHGKDWCWSWSYNTLGTWCKAKSLERPLVLGMTEDKRRREWQRMRRYDSITNSVNMHLSKLQEIVKDREAWYSAVPRVAKIQTWLSNLTTISSERNESDMAPWNRIKILWKKSML